MRSMKGKFVSCIFIVIGFNDTDLTSSCIENLKFYLPKEYNILLFDNGSEESQEEIAKKYSVEFYRSEKNLGYAGGSNFAIEKALQLEKTDVVCVLNNDIFIDKGFSGNIGASLVNFMEDDKLAAVMPCLFQDKEHKKPENFGILYYKSGLAFQNRTGKVLPNVLLNGAFLFIKTSVCKELVGTYGYIFQPLYFFNAEDVELSLRLVSRGYVLKVDKNLSVQHLGAQSLGAVSRKGYYYSWRNLFWTFFITQDIKGIIINLPYFIIGQIILFVLSMKYKYLNIWLLVIVDTFKTRGKLMEIRREYLSNRIFNPEYYKRVGIVSSYRR